MLSGDEYRYTPCAVCGKEVDKLPFEFGGSKEGCQIAETPDLWACSRECYYTKVNEMIDSVRANKKQREKSDD